MLLLECERILPALTTESCQPVVLKGAALALAWYRVPTERWFLDLDILIPPDEVDEACHRLESLGYRPLKGGRDPLFYEKYHLHRIMLGPQGAVVELHWDLTLPNSVYTHDVAGVVQRAIKRRIGRLDVLCAAPVDQVLHGVYQNIADGFVDLRRTLDCAHLLDQLQQADWAYLVAESRKTGMDRGLWMSLHVVKSVLGRSAPHTVMMALQPGRLTRRVFLGLQVDVGCLERRAASVDGYVETLHLMATPSNWQRCREVMRSLSVGEATMLDRGYRPDHLPGIIKRARIGLWQFKRLLVVTWRVARAFVS